MLLYYVLCLAAAAIIFIAVYITAFEPYWFRVVRTDIRSDRLPGEFDGKKVLFLTDIHTSKYGRLERTLVRRIKEAGAADLCVITGDLMLNERSAGALRRVLEAVDSENGIYYVSGNSEFKPYVNGAEMLRSYGDMGLVNLDNRMKTFSAGPARVQIVGLCNFEEVNACDPEAAFRDAERGVYTLCLSHSPAVIEDLLPYEPDLVLSGHTHGGQVKLPLFNVVYAHMDKNAFVNDGYYSPETLSRLFDRQVRRTSLLVSRGIGTSAIRIRFRCRPEIHVLTFYKNDSQGS